MADLNLDDLEMERSRYSAVNAYAQWKPAILTSSRSPARELRDGDVSVVSLSPGVISTDLFPCDVRRRWRLWSGARPTSSTRRRAARRRARTSTTETSSPSTTPPGDRRRQDVLAAETDRLLGLPATR